MKKIKLVLSAVAVFAVVGSALAFTKPFTDTYCVKSVSGGAGACTSELSGRTETTGAATHRGYIKVTNCNAQCSTQIRLITN